jgi:hypothetical protein
MIEFPKKQDYNTTALIAAVGPMLNNRLRNYIVPGLSSYLVGGAAHGKVRMFHAERTTRDMITPHSHRFDFTCLVLQGHVRNNVYWPHSGGDAWCLSTIQQVCGEGGVLSYTHVREDKATRFECITKEYGPGDVYSMACHEIHSIEFYRGSKVLFFEGPQIWETSQMIEPWVDGRVVPTFRTEDWMFLRGDPQ